MAKANHKNHGSRNVRDGLRNESPLNKKTVIPTHPEPLLLDIHGAARALSATPWAVRSLLWDKKIPFVKIGRRFLVRPADLNAYIENQLGEGAA
jgi:excisionase family DNA binding protein